MTRIDREDGRSLRSGFLRSAAQTPCAPCLVIKGETLTYGEVERLARCLASNIVARLGRPARRIGIFASRNREAYVGVLAALFAGGSFVPLNPNFPAGRTRAMIEASDLDAIIVDAALSARLDEILDGYSSPPLLIMPDKGAESLEADPGGAATNLPSVMSEDIAYILFTSGSTGTPKGVPVTNANVCSFIDWAVSHYAITAKDRFSQTFDQTFDLSIFDLFVAWERGATVYAMQPLDLLAPARFIRNNALTVWFSVPSIPALMRRKGTLADAALPSLRLSLFCGEPLPLATARAWQAAASNSVVENLYGPTELTIACMWHRWDEQVSPPLCINGIVPIGRPFAGLGAALVDDELKLVPDGEAGELCLCGAQTTPGYWRDPGRTADRFVRLSGDEQAAGIFYRTGDLARRLPDGTYVYLGRTDHQIKVQGYRVELGEIEACLQGQQGVIQAVAIGWPEVDGRADGIVGFVTGNDIDTAACRQAVAAQLPAYMVPSQVLVIDDMPLNANGKIDRRALAATLTS
ncbi:amino acid adenylation domain-containing protein [Sphingomonas humi]|uniref:D-alanine--poly(Phosphoribitol) ligase n=1 Tax=Sphingomonas humi TaxID=335630 RepID=A0ABP7SA98_9SPHN